MRVCVSTILVLMVGCAAQKEAPVTTPPASAPASVASRTIDLSQIPPGKWVPLFDGRTLNGWRVLTEKAFVGHAEVEVRDGAIHLHPGQLQTGIGWAGGFPRDNYEVTLEAMRTEGSDFFCGMTFPVGSEPCTLIVGGWGGTIVGLSNVDHMHAAENVTTNSKSFDNNQWYTIRLRVTPEKIEAWIDDNQMISLERADHHFSVWWEQEAAQPFGIATWSTGAALRNIRFLRVSGP